MPSRRAYTRIAGLLALAGTLVSLALACSSDPAPVPGPDGGGNAAQSDGGGTPYAPETDDSGNRKPVSADAMYDRCGKNCIPM